MEALLFFGPPLIIGVGAGLVVGFLKLPVREVRWRDVRWLAQMLAGHADIGTTANIYAHLDTTDLEAALQELEAED
jgi:hypothetical protein